LSTRNLPSTKVLHKGFLTLHSRPIIQYAVDACAEIGVKEIIFIYSDQSCKHLYEGYFAPYPWLENHLKEKNKLDLLKVVQDIIPKGMKFSFAAQNEPRGNGHAILMAKELVGDRDFIVMWPDDVYVNIRGEGVLKQLIDVYDKTGASVLGVQTVDHEKVCKYGIIDGTKEADRLYKVADMVEKPPVDKAPTDVAILGRYVINQEVFGYLETQETGAGGEIQLTDALRRMTLDGKPMYAYDFKGTRYDVGSQIGFVQANIEFALRDPRLKGELSEYIKKLSADIEGTIRFD
jgi:UTP--glucose-1-phosphate uridylyltransferase